MQFQIPLDTLFTQVFGIGAALTRHYKVPSDEQNQANLKFTVNMGTEITEDLITSQLGTPVQFPMGFVGNESYNYRKNGKMDKKFLRGLWLPFTSVASFTRAKRITETFMSAQEGSVIEEYGFEPWDIRIQGFIIKNDKSLVVGNSTIEDQVKELQQWEGLSDSVSVKGKIFEWLDIHKIAILKIAYPEARELNMEVVKPFEITARSVKPIELLAV